MGLIPSYPSDLDNISDIKSNKQSTTPSIRAPETNNQLLLEGYIVSTCSTLIIPQCLINLIIKYFAITHCIMLYSRNDNIKRGSINIIDLNQSSNKFLNILTLKNSVDLNHKIHLNPRKILFSPNIQYNSQSRLYHTIFYAKNIVRGGSVDAILINPQTFQIENTLNLPFIGYNQNISSLKYSYSLQSLIAQDSMEGYLNTLELSSNSNSLKWIRYRDKKYKMKVYGERQYLCDSCFIGNNDNKLFVVNYECCGQIFDLRNKLWNDLSLSRFTRNRLRYDFGICYDRFNRKVYISGGCINCNDYKLDINSNFVHWSSYYDFHKDKWYQIENTINYHECNPLLWFDKYNQNILYIVSSDIINQRERKNHFKLNDDINTNDDDDYKFKIKKIGKIEFYDSRCYEKKNKWMLVNDNKQLSNIINNKININNGSSSNKYIPSKLYNCLL